MRCADGHGYQAARTASGHAPRAHSFPRTTYLIFFTPRSGSYLLCEALTASGLAGFPAEYFGPGQADRLGESWGVTRQADYLHMLFRHRTSANGVFGAKVTWRHFRGFVARSRAIEQCTALPPALVASTLLPNLRYVWLTRRDKLRQAISYSKAMQTGVWSVTGSPTADGSAPQYDRALITELLQRIREDEMRTQKYFSVNRIDPLVVVYEEFVSRYESTCGDILKYLGLQPPPELQLAGPTLTKQRDAQTEDWVRRYQQEIVLSG
jgi:trehalose 2-sulfotransferase